MNRYKWQGVRVKTDFGYCKVTENKDKPMWWYNFECNWDDYNESERRGTEDRFAHIPAIKVTYENQVFCIANHHGIGVHKLINGGWPSHTHFSLPVDSFDDALTIPEKQIYCPRHFDLEGYEAHESLRRCWQKKNYPVEFEKRESLRQSINKVK